MRTARTRLPIIFSTRAAREYEDLLYENLGLLYLQQERYTDAARTFQAFVELHPVHRQAPYFQMRVIETYEQGGFPTLVLQAKEDFVNRYQLQGSYWEHHDSHDSAQVLEFLKSTMTDLSRYYHAQAQRTHTQADYDQAVHWYRTFLGSFADSGEAPQMNFLLAELLFESGKYQAATQEYVHTAYDYGEHARAAEAGYAAVLAYDHAGDHLAGSRQTRVAQAVDRTRPALRHQFPATSRGAGGPYPDSRTTAGCRRAGTCHCSRTGRQQALRRRQRNSSASPGHSRHMPALISGTFSRPSVPASRSCP